MTSNNAPVDGNNSLERIRALRSKSPTNFSNRIVTVKAGYFGTATDLQLDQEFDDMFDDFVQTVDAATARGVSSGHLGRQSEGDILLGVGESGTRKTSTIRRAIFKRPEFEGYSDVPHENMSPLISIIAPSPCTLKQLGIAIATAMGYTPRPSIEENEVWTLVRKNLAVRGARFIHIDEMQHVTQNKNVAEIPKIQNTLKRLLQTPEWPVWLILSGLPEIANMFEGDIQVWRRARFIKFRQLDFQRDADLCHAMVRYFAGEKAALDLSTIVTDEFIHRLMHASLYRLGIAIDFTIDAIHEAFRANSPALTVGHFARSFGRTGADDENNVFIVPGDFLSVDVSKFFTNGLNEEAAEAGSQVQPVSRKR